LTLGGGAYQRAGVLVQLADGTLPHVTIVTPPASLRPETQRRGH